MARSLQLALLLIFSLSLPRPVFSLEDFLMGISNKHASTAYLYLGKERRFFAEEGIDLKLIFIPVSVAPTALTARQIDGMEYGSSGILLRTRGAPLMTLFSQSYKPGWFLMSSPSVTDLRQLSGKTVTVGSLGSGSHNVTVEILKQAGVNPDTVVFIGGRGGSDVRLQMLSSGAVQAANLVSPYNFMAEKQGFRTLMFYGDRFELAQFGLIVNESSLKSRKPFLKRALRAFVKSHLYTLSHREETVKWVAENLKMDKENAERTFDVLLKVSTRSGIASDSSIQNSLDQTARSESAKKTELVDYGLLREVLREMGVKPD
ncbi:MAG TPA: ABC transporter substrate-binding protein [Candidatus Binatia bacterium]|jgi:ABC-type nitrate/sulfonate/bicarbonate transport system substrate-binding protein